MSVAERALLVGPYRELQDKILRAGDDIPARLRLLADYHFARHPQISNEMRQAASALRSAQAEIEELRAAVEEYRQWLNRAPKI